MNCQAALRQSQREARRLAKSHYENFVVASVLLPRRMRQPFYNVYAFCRTADDLADESPSPALALERLDDFQNQLNDTFSDRACRGLFVALRHTIREFEIPQQPLDDLLDAFRQDQHKTRYANIDELIQYAGRSANPVGRIVLHLGGCFNEVNASLSDEICTGLQLTNCWQDVARDHSIGRVYLPADEMLRLGVTESMLREPQTAPELRRLLALECDRAEKYLRRGLTLVDRVPTWLSKSVKLFAHGGLETLKAIRSADYDVMKSRPRVGKWRQARLMMRVFVGGG